MFGRTKVSSTTFGADAAALAGIFSRAVLHFPDNSGFNATAGTPPPVTPTVHTSAGMIKSNQPAAIYVCECVCALVRRLMVGMECSYLCLYFVGGIYFHIHTHSRARTRTHMYLHNSSLVLVLYSSVRCSGNKRPKLIPRRKNGKTAGGPGHGNFACCRFRRVSCRRHRTNGRPDASTEAPA